MPAMTCPQCNYLIVNPSQPCPSCHYVLSASIVPPSPQNFKTETIRMPENNYSGSPEKKLLAVEQKPLVASICQITAMLFFLLSLIGSFTSKLPFEFKLYIILACFWSCLFLYAMGEIVAQLAIATYNAAVIYHNMKQDHQ